jgi:hypothetical protein
MVFPDLSFYQYFFQVESLPNPGTSFRISYCRYAVLVFCYLECVSKHAIRQEPGASFEIRPNFAT